MSSVWIFQSNPEMYPLLKDLPELTNSNPDGWPIRHRDPFKNKIKAGDLALLWISDKTGEKRGIHAIARIRNKKDTNPYDKTNLQPWAKLDDLWVEFECMKEIKPPLLASYLKKIGLSNLSIIRVPRGTIFQVRESEWEILSKEIKIRIFTNNPPSP
jgi:hypothetical protein